MANWKKVIVSGSSAELNHITASGNISASGFLFGVLPENTGENQVVVYNSNTGRLEFKVLDLVSTTAAPPLFIADLSAYTGESDGQEENFNFKLSYTTGSNAPNSAGPVPFTVISSSATSSTEFITCDSGFFGLNDEVIDVQLSNTAEIFNPGNSATDSTPPTDVLNGLVVGTDKISMSIDLQGISDTVVPAFPAGFASQNYKAQSFNDGGIGDLLIFVNTTDVSSPTAKFSLTGSNSSKIDGVFFNTIKVNLAATSSNLGTDGSPDSAKHHRSGSGNATSAGNGDIVIPPDLQNDGFNFAYIIHSGSKDGTTFGHITNFVQWFYDTDGAGQAINDTSNVATGPHEFGFDTDVTKSLSGVRFLTQAAGTGKRYRFAQRVNNQYRNVYSTATNAIQVGGVENLSNYSITQSAVDSVASITFSSVNGTTKSLGALSDTTAASASRTEVTFSGDISLPSDTFHQPSDFTSTAATSVSDPDFLEGLSDNAEIGIDSTTFLSVNSGHKSNKTITYTGNISKQRDFLYDSQTVRATENNFEDFRGEEFRLQSKSYDGVTNPSSSAYYWTSSVNIVDGGEGHNEGLQQYYTHLMYPGKHAGDSSTPGNFNTTYGPTGQPSNYSSAAGTREYVRYFKVPLANSGGKNFNIEFV
jgi:hypothetical protein